MPSCTSIGTFDVRAIRSDDVCEFFLTLPGPIPIDHARDAYAHIADILRSHNAWIIQERLFASADAISPALRARAAAFGDLHDGVIPTLLTPQTPDAQIVGIQVHAAAGIPRAKALGSNARLFHHAGHHWLTASGLRGATASPAPAQARQAFESADALLHDAGTDFRSVARTWIWMDDILSWYTPFNTVRTSFFRERGLIGPQGLLPASTGISVSPADNHRGAIDLFAVWGGDHALQRHHAAGRQRSAYEYGSAFARAATAKTPAGSIVFCSGTAAIDEAGNTCHLGDVHRQIQMTMENVLAVFRDLGCTGNDVVQAIAYCKTPEVYAAFTSRWLNEFPCLVMQADVCRDDLLFELEAAASPGATKL